VRYCIVRHVGFLIGEGHPAGDASAPPETIEQVIALLTRPAPSTTVLEQVTDLRDQWECRAAQILGGA
jgi:hypothetical protein